MSELQEKHVVTTEHLPRLFRSRTIDYALIIVGALVAAFGACIYFVPASWILADLGDAWYLGSWIAGGVLLGSQFSFAEAKKKVDPYETVTLGRTGIKMSRFCLGTGMTGGNRCPWF